MTFLKKGLTELALNRPRSSIMEVKSALPVPFFRLFFSFFFLRVLVFQLYVSVTLRQEQLWTLCSRFTVVFSKTFIVSTEKISLVYRPLGFFELDPLSLYEEFLWTLVSGKWANKVELYLEND